VKLIGRGITFVIQEHKWDAGKPEPDPYCNGRKAGDLRFSVKGSSQELRDALKGEGIWRHQSMDNPDCCHSVDLEFEDPLVGVVRFECFRWEEYDSSGEITYIGGRYVER
jgi:hypothetical protein